MRRKAFTLTRTPLVIVATVGVLLLALQVSLPADAQSQVNLAGNWDRLNPDQSNPTPEHEVLRCGGNARPKCVYDKHPEPKLGFENPPDSTFGHFRGVDVTVGWACPTWFPSSICDSTAFVASGEINFVLSDGSELSVNQELIVTHADSDSVLYVYWVNEQFACPWFKSFDEALAANPFPTPFNGEDWPYMDCIFAP